ncbi:tRNA (adenosine(37)-N6)-dimethylallyltransferase MiaA [Coprothermobacter platensis]|uniref:tRNA (adenosine(37)-N6)-dimethylallyltransferase MiaA n=1 Tax=Coprothermobacter platensis TaxID=108819 RepID=UPI000380C9A7|nr:tRNA (adenosine(37)-N6)-dimethylallyltransferase MiaA [Coprothermobacter platensis]
MERLLISVLGPTGVGKTNLSLYLTQELKAANIISIDTGAFYKETSVGTAKPEKTSISVVKHWFVDCLSCSELYSVGSFVQDCSEIIEDLWQQDITPILVAGTLFYYYALLGERSYASLGTDYSIRSEVESDLVKFGESFLRNELKAYDPLRESEIAIGDERRLVRAVEILRMGKKPSEAQVYNKLRFNSNIKIGLMIPRDPYRERLMQRVNTMIEKGLIEEVEALLKQFNESSPCLKQIGYKEVCNYLKGNISSVEELKQRIFYRHWDYARKQMKWLKKDDSITWFDASQPFDDLCEEVTVYVRRTLDNSTGKLQ